MNTDLINKYIETVDKALVDAENNLSKIDPKILLIPGMSGNKTRHFLNNVVQGIGGRYLEVGVWAGSTFCSALNGSITNDYCVACDNWSEFGGPKNNFLTNVSTFINQENVSIKFLEKDCFEITKEDLEVENFGKFPIYLYDGPHKRIHHHQALTKFIDYVEDTFVYLCDDWNWTDDVEVGTRDAYKDLNLTIHKEWVMKTPNNTDSDRPGWWNGYYAAVISK
jgi:hypothetical protein